MKKILTTLLAMTLALTMFAVPVTVSASSSSNMSKVIYYYHKKNIKKATTYNKKLPKYASETCVKKMPSKMKKAYKKVLQGYRLYKKNSTKKYIWDVYFSDIDNDNKADMLIVYGSCEANAIIRVYQYKNGKAVYVAHSSAGHSMFYAYPGHKGILRMYGQMDYEVFDKLTLSGKKIHTTNIGSRDVSRSSYFPLREQLRGYVKYNKTTDAYYIDYSILK